VPFSDKDEAKRLGAGFEYYKDGQRPEGAPGCARLTGGRAGGHKGGRGRAANLISEELSAIGRKGAAAKRAKQKNGAERGAAIV
jgi:hypothetical protein